MIVFFILSGLLGVTPLGVILGLNYSYIFPVVLTILYFLGFIYLIIRVQRATNSLLKRIHFNLALVLRNENDGLLMRYGIKAKLGYLSKWVEFHRYH